MKTVTSFGENLAEGIILKQTLPNGVTRLQLPREAWHNQDAFSSARVVIDDQKIKGVKTIWHESFSIKDISEAAKTVLAQNIGKQGSSMTGIYKGINVRVLKDRNSGKVVSVFPDWIQQGG